MINDPSISKSYYAVIPAPVRYCQTIPDGAKLLYGEITALCNEKGYCWAENTYFAGLYGKSPFTISRWISSLAQAGFIYTLVDNISGNSRKIWLVESQNPIAENRKTLLTKSAKGYRQKPQDPIDEKRKQNNTVNTTVNITTEVITATAEKAAPGLLKTLDLETGKKEKAPPPSGAPSPRQPGEAATKKPRLLIVNQDDQYLKFDSPVAAEQLWQRWYSHRQAIGHKFKTEDSIRTALNKLINLSNGSTHVAGAIIDESIANGWQGLFAPKVQKQHNHASNDPIPAVNLENAKARTQRILDRYTGNR